MLLSDFSFELPGELIAQQPTDRRDGSRMLVVDREALTFTDRRFGDISGILSRGDVLVLNNTRVFPARLSGTTDSGARVEIFLIEDIGDGLWTTLARPAKRLKSGKRIDFAPGFSATVVERAVDGKTIVRFDADGDFFDRLEMIGQTPLPPYIRRDGDAAADRERYQTVFAKNRGAIAAPTAGLHFTADILAEIAERGISVAEITLHVGYGTFEPVRVDDIADHRVAPERYFITEKTAETLNKARQEKRRIVAVGTTSTRAIETNLKRHGRFTPGSHSADLTITPGYRFEAAGALLTNFHLPQSSLLVLTSTFGGHELIMSAYQHAVASKYRFYSYGDCMLIV
jgi:S-adenosylmethionine:tRNA ribosyltransferase-isomerase